MNDAQIKNEAEMDYFTVIYTDNRRNDPKRTFSVDYNASKWQWTNICSVPEYHN
jgi:hypothetical protein